MDKSNANKIPSSLDDVKGTLEPKTKNPDKVSEDQTTHFAIEQLGGSLIDTGKQLKQLKLNFKNIKYV